MAENKSILIAAAALAAGGCAGIEEPSKGIAYRKAAPVEPQPVSTSARIADAYATVVGIPPTQTANAEENLETAVRALAARKVNNRNVTEVVAKTAELARLLAELEGTPLALPPTQTAQVFGKHEQNIFDRMGLVLGATSPTQTAAVVTTGTARRDVLETVADIATRYNGIATARALKDGRVTLDVTLGNTWAAQWTFTPVTPTVQYVEKRQRSATETAVAEPGFDLKRTVDGTVVKLDEKTWKVYAAKTEAERQGINDFASGALGTTQTARLAIRTVEGWDAKDTKTRNTYLLVGTSLIKLSDKYGRQELDEVLQKNAALEQNDTAVLATLHQKGLVSDAQLKAAEDYRTRADRDFGKMLERADPATVTAELEKYFATQEGKGAYGRIGVTFVEGRQVRELGLTSADNPHTYFDAEIPLGKHLSVLGATLTARILAESENNPTYFTPGDNAALSRRTEILLADKAERLRLLNSDGKKLNGWHEANPHQLNPTTWGALKGKTFYIQGYQKFPVDGKSK